MRAFHRSGTGPPTKGVDDVHELTPASRTRTPRRVIIAVAVVAVLTLVWRRVEEAYFASEDSGWWPYLAAVFILAGLTWAGALRQPRSRRVVSCLLYTSPSPRD